MRNRGEFRKRIAALAALVPALCARQALADVGIGGEGSVSLGGGLFAGYAFGERPSFHWGVEAFGTHYFERNLGCSSDPLPFGVGALGRFSMLGLSRPSATLAAHGGREIHEGVGLDLELGLSLAGDGRGELEWSPHTGLTVESILLASAYTRQEWLFDEYSLGAGARLPGFVRMSHCVVGRPFRDAAGRAPSALLWRHADFDERAPSARRWAERAREECASIPAFLQLAAELCELGAPRALVLRALNAAEEELRHTLHACRLAEHFGGAPLIAAPPPFEPRLRLPRELAVQRVIEEAWLDGCLNEGVAAALADAERETTRDPLEAGILGIIAEDEAGHAELALDVIRWGATSSCSPSASPVDARTLALEASVPAPPRRRGPAHGPNGASPR